MTIQGLKIPQLLIGYTYNISKYPNFIIQVVCKIKYTFYFTDTIGFRSIAAAAAFILAQEFIYLRA